MRVGGIIPRQDVEVETGPQPVVAEASAEADRPGWVLSGRYRVHERLGSGGMADVFRAHDELLGRDVAVKVFRTLGPAEEAGGPERQERELQALARLSHPHLITLFDASITDRPAYLVMELVDGPSLAARLTDGPLPESEVRAIGSQIADALAYVHAQGMVHRDVKPANILLGTDGIAGDGVGRARLSDFGIVRLLGTERLTAADFTLGTASYLAPEQARGGDVTPAADVYSLGLVLIEALTGTRSFDGTPVEAVLARLSRSPDVPADLPQPWPGLLRAMTASDAGERPTPAEVSRTLRTAAAGTSASFAVPVAAAAGAAFGGSVAAFASDLPTSALGPLRSGPVQVPTFGDTGRLPVADERRPRGLLVAAMLLLALIGAASFFVFAGASPNSGTPSGGVGPSSSPVRPAPRHSPNVVNAVVPKATVSHSASHSVAPSSAPAAPRSSNPASSAPAPSSSAVPPSTAATTGAPTTTAVATGTAGATTSAAALAGPGVSPTTTP